MATDPEQVIGSVPGLQPTIQRGGQYAVQVQRAGRNKLMDLADALSQVNPILSEFGNIRKLEQQRKQKLEEALQEEGYRAFKTDPATMAVELERTQQKIRAAVERGEIPDEANSARIVGALKAKAEVLAKRDYRNILNNPEILLTTKDPVVEALKQREEFFNREEFQSPIVRDHAIKFFEEVENEFINTVEKRLAAFEVEEGKGFWLEKGRPAINQVISGQLDVNDEVVKTWLNDPAGLFQGSRKYAWDNLISETLNEGLSKDPSEEGSISPQQAETFLDKLRTLDLGGGVKFADAEVGNSITSYYDKINDRRSKWEARKNEQYNKQYRIDLAQAETELLELMGDGEVVSPTDEARIKKELRAKTPVHLQTQVNKDINDLLKELVKPSTESTQLSVANFELLIDEGDDLDKTLDSVMKAAANRAITPKERNTLIQRIESSRNFTKLVYDDPIMKTLRNGYRETITGFEQVKPGATPTGIRLGFFTRLGVSTEAQEEAKVGTGGYVATENNFGVYYQIQRKMGKDAADMFVNKRYVAFEKDLKQAFQAQFEELEQDEQTSPQEAKAKIMEQMEVISDKVFKRWTEESIAMAVDKYKVQRNLLEGI